MIIFYDIPSKLAGNAWSPNTWKVRYTLNLKNLEYKTEWIEYPDIEAYCKTIGIPPDPVKSPVPKPLSGESNGFEPRRYMYTLPAIWDTKTGVKICDSRAIVEYLEETYPNANINVKSLSLLHLQQQQQQQLDSFEQTFKSQILTIDLWVHILPLTPRILNGRSAEHFYQTQSVLFGCPLESVLPISGGGTGTIEAIGSTRTSASISISTGISKKDLEGSERWERVKKGFDVINGWYYERETGMKDEMMDGESSKGAPRGPFMMGGDGDEMGWCDVVVGAHLKWMKMVWEGEGEGEGGGGSGYGELWKDVASWNKGRWGRLLEAMDSKYGQLK